MNDLISREKALAEFRDCDLTPDGGIDANHVVEFIEQLPTEEPERKRGKWIENEMTMGGMTSSIPYEYDGRWIIVTDGKNVSVERIKKDAQDHFSPNGRWFELEDVVAWMPLPEPFNVRMEDSDED